MAYIDGFVAAVPTAKKEEYRSYAAKFGAIFKEYGALGMVESWGDDVPEGKLTSFPMAVQCRDDETTVFSWITWPSREVRQSAWEKMEQDERFHPDNSPMPFDGKRMIFGGFEVLVEV